MNKTIDVNSENSARAYQIWPGKNKFFCKGKIMMGPDFKKAFISFSLIFFPEILFLCTTGRHFIESPLILVISFILAIVSLYFHYQVATSDPGYIPKQLPPFARGPFGAPTLAKSLVNDSTRACAIDRPYIEVPFNGRLIKLKYCLTCKAYLGMLLRPPRASHCTDCGVCVDKFDHHCPWVGNCIGKRNYRIYLGFLAFTTILIGFNMVFACLEIQAVIRGVKKDERNGDKVFYKLLEKSGGTLLMVAYTSIIMWFVLFLAIFHSYLLTTNQTTHEYLKKIWKLPPNNPYSYLNLLRNTLTVLFKPKSPHHFDLFVPIDLNLDIYTVSPSRLYFQSDRNIKTVDRNPNCSNSPLFNLAGHDESLLEENQIIPEQI